MEKQRFEENIRVEKIFDSIVVVVDTAAERMSINAIVVFHEFC